MKLISFNHAGHAQAGVLLRDDTIVPLTALGFAPGGMDALFDACRERPLDAVLSVLRSAASVADGAIPFSDVTLTAPIPRPRQDFVCLGLNYRSHAEESNRYLDKLDPQDVPTSPVYFSKRAPVVVGHGEGIQAHQQLVHDLDYEVELACVIGRTASNVPPDKVKDHILGYTVANDVSARTLQTQHRQWYLGKSLDTFAVLGPWIVLADDISYPPHLGIRCLVNGQQRQSANTSELIFDLDYIISDLSRGMTLLPGTVILTGTPAGVGFAADTPRYLTIGDVVRCEIDGIGVLENTIVPTAYDADK